MTDSKNPETKTEFASLCGFPFDPAKKSDCYAVCQNDNPADFKACEDNFKAAPIKPKAKPAGGKGKSKWGHINGSQAGLIDDYLVGALKPAPLEDIAEFAKGKIPRVLHHLKHLVNNKGATVNLNKDNGIFWTDNPKMKKVKSTGSVTTLFLRKPKVVEDKSKDEKSEKKGDKK